MRIRHEVIEIDLENKRVKVRNFDEEKDFWEHWDDLLIPTGASPFVPNMENMDASGIFALSTLQSGINVFNFIKKKKPTRAVVLGGGYIGLEMADLILKCMTEQHVKVFLKEKLVKFEKNAGGSIKSVITDKQTIPANIVILGMGVKPNAELATRKYHLQTTLQKGISGR